MNSADPSGEESQQSALELYRSALQLLQRAEIPFMLGGTIAFASYTGISRNTKDLDLYVRERDLAATLAAFATAGWHTETPYPHWLAKAHNDNSAIDIIFNSGNGMTPVDDAWFRHAVKHTLLGMPVHLTPPEELLCSKAFVQERERYDGADVAHILRAYADRLDWRRIFIRFGPRWRVLLAHLVLFGFIYPGERDNIPTEVMEALTRRLQAETAHPPAAADQKLCRGTLISREQYLIDVEQWGYEDARLQPEGPLSAEEITRWTEAIGE